MAPSKLTQDAQIMKTRFEFENEIIDEELYHFSEEEVDRLMIEKPW